MFWQRAVIHHSVSFCEFLSFHVKSGEKKIPGVRDQVISSRTCPVLQPVSRELKLRRARCVGTQAAVLSAARACVGTFV